MSLLVSIRHHFADFELDADFEAPNGITALFGRSGAGKTSIINAIAGLLKPDRGRIVIDSKVLHDTDRGIHLPVWRRRVGYVFQDARLFPHLTVRRNLTFGSWFAGGYGDGDEFDRIAGLLGLESLLDRRPANLSGGERQRVAIGRALLSRPRLLLMDEPLASLDDERKEEILPYLETLREDTQIPIIYVSHSIAEVARLATTVVAMRAGKAIRAGPAAEIFSDPHAVPLLGVRSAGALVPAEIVCHDPEDGLTELAISGGRLLVPLVEAPPGTQIRLRVEAQDIILSRAHPDRISTLNVLPAVVTAIHLGEGPGAAVGIRIGADHLLARITRRSVRKLGLAPGENCFAIMKSTAIARIDIGTGVHNSLHTDVTRQQ